MPRISQRLSERQEQVIDFVCEGAAEGRAPTQADIAREFQISRQGAAAHVRALIRKGWLLRRGRYDLRPTDVAWQRQVRCRQEQRARATLPHKLLAGRARAVACVQVAMRDLDRGEQQLVMELASPPIGVASSAAGTR